MDFVMVFYMVNFYEYKFCQVCVYIDKIFSDICCDY